MTDEITISTRLRDSSVVEYVNHRLEEDDLSKTELAREAFQKLAEADQERTESNSLVAANPRMAAREIESVVVVEDSNGDLVGVDLNDESSIAYQDDDFALPLEKVPNLDDLDPVGGQYNTGRDKPVKWVLNNQSSHTETEVIRIIKQAGGFGRTTAPDIIPRLVSEGEIYPHPSAPDGVLSDGLMTDIRCELAGYPDAHDVAALSEKEKEQYPADWSTLLPHYSEFVQKEYYSDKSEYLWQLSEAMQIAVQIVGTVPKIDKRVGGKDAMTNLEKIEAWNKVATALVEELRVHVDLSDLSYPLSRIRLNANRTKPDSISEQKIEYDNPLPKDEFYEELVEFRDALNALIQEEIDAREGVGVDSEDLSMSVESALDVFGWSSLEDKTVEDVKTTFTTLAKETHPDSSDYESAEMIQKAMNAREVLSDVVAGAADENESGVEGVSDDDGSVTPTLSPESSQNEVQTAADGGVDTDDYTNDGESADWNNDTDEVSGLRVDREDIEIHSSD